MSPKKEREVPSMVSPEDRPPRSSLACSHCRARKIRCTGGHPCKRCGELKKVCEYAKVTAEENIAARARKAAQAARRAAAVNPLSGDGPAYEVALLPMTGGEPIALDPATGKAARPRFMKHTSDPLGLPRTKRLGRDRRSGIVADGFAGSSESPEDLPSQLPLAPSVPRPFLDGQYPPGFMAHAGQAIRRQAPPPLRLSTSFGSAPTGGEPGYPEPWSGVSSLAQSPYLHARDDSGVGAAVGSDGHPLDFAQYGYHPSSGDESPWLPPASVVSEEALLQSWLDSSAFVASADGTSPTINPSALSSSATGSDQPYWHPDPRAVGVPAGVRTPASSSSPVFSTQSTQAPPALQSSSTGTSSSTESTPMLATPSPDEHAGLHLGVGLPMGRPFNGVPPGHPMYGMHGAGLMVDGLEAHKSAPDADSMPPPHHIPHTRRIRHGSHASVSYPLTHSAMVAESRGSPLKHARSWSANLEYHPGFAMSPAHQPPQQVHPQQQPPHHQRNATAPQALSFPLGMTSPQFDGIGLADDIHASMFPGLAGSAFAESAGGLTPGLAAAAAVPPSRRPSLTLAARSCTAPSGVVTLAGFADASQGPGSASMPTGSSPASSFDDGGLSQKWQTPRHDPIDWNTSPFDGRHHSIVSTSSSSGPPHHQHHHHAAAAAAAAAASKARGNGASFDAANDVALAQQAQDMHLHSVSYGMATAGGFGY